MIDRVYPRNSRRKLYEVPVGFKYFRGRTPVTGRSWFCGGRKRRLPHFCAVTVAVWTTDKDGIIAALLAAEIMATA